MKQVWEIVSAMLLSVGGAGVIIMGIVKWTSNIIAERLSKQYQLEMDKRLEQCKADLSKKTYISKARFDTEFKIYRELSEKMLMLVDAVVGLQGKAKCVLDAIGQEKIQGLQEWYEKDHPIENALNAAEMSRKAIYSNAAFIPCDFYTECVALNQMCYHQIGEYFSIQDKLLNHDIVTADGEDREKLLDLMEMLKENDDKVSEIALKQQKLIFHLREYLNNLEVAE